MDVTIICSSEAQARAVQRLFERDAVRRAAEHVGASACRFTCDEAAMFHGRPGRASTYWFVGVDVRESTIPAKLSADEVMVGLKRRGLGDGRSAGRSR